jgi:hypothetical protein
MVQVMAVYLNSADQVAEVRTALARLAQPGWLSDEPEIGEARGIPTSRTVAVDSVARPHRWQRRDG